MRKELKKHSLPLHGRKVDLIDRLNERKAFLNENGIRKEVQIVLRRIESTTTTALKYERRKLRSNKKTPLTHVSVKKATDEQSQAPLSQPNFAQSSQTISNMKASSSINAVLENHRSLRPRKQSQVPNIVAVEDDVMKAALVNHQRVLRSRKKEEGQSLQSRTSHSVAVEDAKKRSKPPLQTNDSRMKIRRIDNIPKNEASMAMIPSSTARRQRRGNKGRKMVASILTLQPSCRSFELIWANLKGYPLWPAIIEEECPNGKYAIHFFGDYTRATVTKSKIVHFFEGFSLYSKLNSSNTLLHKAVREMHLFIFEKDNMQSCCICDVLLMKYASN